MSVGSDLVGLGAGDVFDAAGQWVASGATWILQQLVTVVTATTAPPVGTTWFTSRLGTMAAIGASLALPLTCLAAAQAVVRQSPGLLVRTVVLHLPVALVCTGTAVAVVQMGLSATDDLSREVLGSTGAGLDLSPVSAALGSMAGAPSFAVLLGAMVVAVAGLTLWLEMAVRAAAVSVAVLFLPLVMAAMVWPAIGHWCRRLAETLAALVLSKLVVVGVLALAAEALAQGLGSPVGGGGFSAVVTGAALLVVAAACPFALMRLVPAVEAGAIAQLEQARHHLRRAPLAARTAGDTLLRRAGGDGGADGPVGPVGPADDGLAPPPPPGGPGGGAPGGRPGSSPAPGAGGGAAAGRMAAAVGCAVAGGAGGVAAASGAAAAGGGSAASAAASAGGRAVPGGSVPGGSAPAGSAAAAAVGGSGPGPAADGTGASYPILAATDQRIVAAVVEEAMDHGVRSPHLEQAAARRLSGMSAGEAYGPLRTAGAPADGRGPVPSLPASGGPPAAAGAGGDPSAATAAGHG